MKKVTINEVHELLDLSLKVQDQGHYCDINLYNHEDGSKHISIYVMIGGFDDEKEYSYSKLFEIYTDNEYYIKQYIKTKAYLIALIEGVIK